MTVVASAGPPTATPQAGAPPGATGAPGGAFAALFGAIFPDGSMEVATEGGALNLLPGRSLPSDGIPGPNLPDVMASDGDPRDEKKSIADPKSPATAAVPAPLIAISADPPPVAVAPNSAAGPAPPADAVLPDTLPVPAAETAAAKGPVTAEAPAPNLPDAGPGIATPHVGDPSQAMPQPANLPLPEAVAETPEVSTRHSDAVRIETPPPQSTPLTRASPPSAPATPVADADVDPADDVEAEKPDPESHAAPRKTPAASNAVNTAEKADGAGRASAAPPATANPSPSVASATAAEPLLPALPLAAGPDAGVKTVSLSSLAALSQQAAVTAIGAAIATEANGGTNRFVIRLDPPDLGRIDVRLHFDRDGELRARLVADRPDTVNLLTRDAGALERALNASGVRTADAGIDVSLRDSSGGFAQQSGAQTGDSPAIYRRLSPAAPADVAGANTFIWVRPQTAAGRLDLTV